MPCSAQTSDMTVDRNIVGWIGEDQVDGIVGNQSFYILSRTRDTAEQVMRFEQPQID